MLLSALAHNVIVWARQWLLPQCPPLRHYGIVRMVRDVFHGRLPCSFAAPPPMKIDVADGERGGYFHTSGFVVRDAHGQMVQLVLNQAAPLARGLADALGALLAPLHVAVTLGQT